MKKVDAFPIRKFLYPGTFFKIDGTIKCKYKSWKYELLTVWYCLRQEFSNESREIETYVHMDMYLKVIAVTSSVNWVSAWLSLKRW